MLALVAALLFLLGLIQDLADASWGGVFTPSFFLFGGLFFVALHLAVPLSVRGRRL